MSWVVIIQTVRPSKPEILTLWPLAGESVDFALSSMTVFPKANRHFSFLIIPKPQSICHRCHALKSFLFPWGWQSELRLFQFPGALHKKALECPSFTQRMPLSSLSRHLGCVPDSPLTSHKVKLATLSSQFLSIFHTMLNYTSTYACGETETAGLGIPGLQFQLPRPYLKYKDNNHLGDTTNGGKWKATRATKLFESGAT